MRVVVAKINFATGLPAYVATGHYVTAGSDTPANLDCLPILEPMIIERAGSISLWQKRKPAPAFTTLELRNEGGRISSWKTRNIRDQVIELWIGEDDQPLATFTKLATARGDAMTVSLRVTITILDRITLLTDRALTANFNPSTWTGPPPLFGQGRKPLALGALAWCATEKVVEYGLDFFTNTYADGYSVSDSELETPPTQWRSTTNGPSSFAYDPSPVFGVRRTVNSPGDDGVEVVGENLFGSMIPGTPPRTTVRIDHLIIEVCRRAGIPESDLDAPSLNALYAAFPALIGINTKDETASDALDLIMTSIAGGFYETPAGQIRFFWPTQSPPPAIARIDPRMMLSEPVVTLDDAPGWSNRWLCAKRVSQNLPYSNSGPGLISTVATGVVHPRYEPKSSATSVTVTAWRDLSGCTAVHNAVAAWLATERRFSAIEFITPANFPQLLPFTRITMGAGIPGYLVDTDVWIVSVKYPALGTNYILSILE